MHEISVMEKLTFREAQEKDCALILHFIKELAAYEKMSDFLGRAGIYLEDLYILPEYRGRGYGKATLEKLARIAVSRGCGRLEWWCLDWNQPSIDFYLSLGAKPMDE